MLTLLKYFNLEPFGVLEPDKIGNVIIKKNKDDQEPYGHIIFTKSSDGKLVNIRMFTIANSESSSYYYEKTKNVLIDHHTYEEYGEIDDQVYDFDVFKFDDSIKLVGEDMTFEWFSNGMLKSFEKRELDYHLNLVPARTITFLRQDENKFIYKENIDQEYSEIYGYIINEIIVEVDRNSKPIKISDNRDGVVLFVRDEDGNLKEVVGD